MTRRAVPALIAVAVLASACGDGSDAPRAEARDAPAARTEAPRDRAGAGAEEGAPAGLATAEFAVEGMTCGGCALATEMAVRKLDGVASVDAGYDEATGEGSCTVEYDPSTVTTDRIAGAIREAGFEPRLREDGS